jgi:hypothetical protein
MTSCVQQFNVENDVMLYAQKVLGIFGDIGTGIILAKNREITYFFGDIAPPYSIVNKTIY